MTPAAKEKKKNPAYIKTLKFSFSIEMNIGKIPIIFLTFFGGAVERDGRIFFLFVHSLRFSLTYSVQLTIKSQSRNIMTGRRHIKNEYTMSYVLLLFFLFSLSKI
jgi:hypothetical protein